VAVEAKGRAHGVCRAKVSDIDPGPIKGEYGPLTVAAVAAFRATKGIVVDGQVGPQTAPRLKSI
jgi:peptidoglycan hydrolase-like protein with peptidoglycan-binding domain